MFFVYTLYGKIQDKCQKGADYGAENRKFIRSH